MLEKYNHPIEKDKYNKESLYSKSNEKVYNNSTSYSVQQRAFTVIPSQKQQTSAIKHEQYEQKGQQLEDLTTSGDLWPSLEQLEALIREEDQANAREIEQLELPLFEAVQTESKPEEKEHTTPEIVFEEKGFNRAQVTSTNQIPMSYNGYPLYDEIDKKHTVEQRYYTTPWIKVVTAVFSSVLTGVLIGYVLLLAVYGVKVWPLNIINDSVKVEDVAGAQAIVDTATTPITEPIHTEAVIGVEQAPLAGPEQIMKVVIAPEQTFTYTALQAGVFTKEDTKQAMLDTLRGSGYPAVAMKLVDGKEVVFAGVASSKETSFQTSHMNNIELFRKPFSIYAPKLSDDVDVEAGMQQWLFNTHDLLLSYLKMSEAQFEQTEVSPIFADSFAVMYEKYKAVNGDTTTMVGDTRYADFHEQLKWHQQKLVDIQASFDAYQLKAEYTTLFAIQQQLLAVLEYEAKWFEN